MKIGELIKIWLAAKDIGMREFAEDIGVSKATVSRLCSGESVDAETLLSLIEYFFRAR